MVSWPLFCFSSDAGSPAINELLPEKLESVLIPDQGYHQIGPAHHCTDMFVLSVTVAFATKLEQVPTDAGPACLTGTTVSSFYVGLRLCHIYKHTFSEF